MGTHGLTSGVLPAIWQRLLLRWSFHCLSRLSESIHVMRKTLYIPHVLRLVLVFGWWVALTGVASVWSDVEWPALRLDP